MDIVPDLPKKVTLKEKVNNLLHKGFSVKDIKKVLKNREKLQNILPRLKPHDIALE